ncbi:MAG TPA: hypothetical protein VGF79_11120 [Bacteroidia bacterium]
MSNIKLNFKLYLLTGVLILKLSPCCSQNDSIQVENLGIETENTDIQDQVQELIKTKIKINSKNKIDLMQTPLLNLIQINAIIDHIYNYGNISHPCELQQITELSMEDINTILPHIDFGVDFKTQIGLILKHEKLKHKLLIQETTKTKHSNGYGTDVSPNLRFQGSPFATKLRWESSIGRFINLTLNYGKDPGEKFEKGHLGFSCQIQCNNKIKQLIIGDFQASYGQGIILGSGINIGKSAAVMNTMRAGSRIRPFRSNSSTAHLTGMAINSQLTRNLRVLFFQSYTTVYADTFSKNHQTFFASENSNGLRRNEMELSSIKRIKSLQTGTSVEWSKANTSIAIACLLNKINSSKVYAQNESNNLFNTTFDSTLLPISIDFKTNRKNSLLFGELGSSNLLSGRGLILGMLNAVDRKTDLSILFRNYSNEFVNPMSGSLSESSKKSSETGLFLGLIRKTGKSSKLNAYFDWFTFNLPSYNMDWPTAGLECMSEIIFAKKNGPEIKMRTAFKNSSENEKGSQHLNRIESIQTSTLRLDFNFPFSKNYSLHSRIEIKNIRSQWGKPQSGYLIYHHLNGSIGHTIKFKLRGMVFNCPQYESRIYVYENDISNSFSIKAYQNSGSHFFLLLQTKLPKNIQIKLRFAHTKYHNLNVIGTGIDQIHSNVQNEIKIELGTSI